MSATQAAPIFILSAGWRSGSTLLQRLVCSDEETIVWGEPYDLCGLVPTLMSSLRPFASHWPPSHYIVGSKEKLTFKDTWVANLYPELPAIRRAHRAFFAELLQASAARWGAKRWGFKEVRLGIVEAQYLQWLFPDAKFLFLYRNPYNAYRSYRKCGKRWFARWPDRPVFTPTAYGRLWSDLVSGFLRGAQTIGGQLIRYEDLAEGRADIGELTAYLGVNADSTVLEQTVGSSRRSPGQQLWAPRLELLLLRRAVEPVARELGYFE